MHMLNVVIVLILSSLMMACSSGDDADISRGSYLPKIGIVYTDILHSHPSFHSKWGISPERTLRFTVSVAVSDPQGVDNLKHISVREKTNEVSWSLLGGQHDVPLSECYKASLRRFECALYSTEKLETLLLEEWEITAEDVDGNVAQPKEFKFRVPGGDLPDTERFVYTSDYAGSTNAGIAALEAMTIADNGIVLTSDLGTRSFHIEFEATDTRAEYYEFSLYDSSPSQRYMGSIEWNSPSISSMALVPGQPLAIDVPWDEITFEEGFFDPTEVNGLHIKLLDDPVNGWSNYVGYSEFITL